MFSESFFFFSFVRNYWKLWLRSRRHAWVNWGCWIYHTVKTFATVIWKFSNYLKIFEFIIRSVLHVVSYLVVLELDPLTGKNFMINKVQKIFQYTEKWFGKKEDFFNICLYWHQLNVFWKNRTFCSKTCWEYFFVISN